LSGGAYEVVLEDTLGSSHYFCRVWSAAGAPPQAAPELALSRDPLVVRGQSLLWRSWPPNATIAALTAGAIIGPVVYHNVHQDNRVPISP
jgi:hypothetical protein